MSTKRKADEGSGPSAPVGDVFKILIATDNHLGYLDKDPLRREDSFITFEEILIQAQKQKVDFVLLGGDLFHDNKPSRQTLYKTMTLLRKYCLGDGSVRFGLINDRADLHDILCNPEPMANYESPNVNVSLPIFSIHGNHDDPSGEQHLAALDLLAAGDLVNYFGKHTRLDEIRIRPLLFQKGDNKIAIYGLGNIRDERLHRIFRSKKVHLVKPEPEHSNGEPDSQAEQEKEYFSVLVLHQNRIAHSPTNAITETMLNELGGVDLVLWGHEHECKINVEHTTEQLFITQPGSSIATSLSESERAAKHIGLLHIRDAQNFKVTPFALTTVRTFLNEDVTLSQEPDLEGVATDAVVEFLEKKVKALIEQANEERKKQMAEFKKNQLHTHFEASEVKALETRLPLIRLRVEYTGFETINAQRFGQRFVGRVANAEEILLFFRRKGPMAPREGKSKGGTDEAEAEELLARATRIPDPIDVSNINALIANFLEDANTANMEMFVEPSMNHAVHSFVEKQEKTAISDFIKGSINKAKKFLEEKESGITNNEAAIAKLLQDRSNAMTSQFKDGDDVHVKEEPDQEVEEPKGKKKANKSAPTTPKSASKKTKPASAASAPPPARRRASLQIKQEHDGEALMDTADLADGMDVDDSTTETTTVVSPVATPSRRASTRIATSPSKIVSHDDDDMGVVASNVLRAIKKEDAGPASKKRKAEEMAESVGDDGDVVEAMPPPPKRAKTSSAKTASAKKAAAAAKKTTAVRKADPSLDFPSSPPPEPEDDDFSSPRAKTPSQAKKKATPSSSAKKATEMLDLTDDDDDVAPVTPTKASQAVDPSRWGKSKKPAK